jgi:DNA polymerase
MTCLITVDFSQVEARGLLWLAGDEENLAPYREGKDAYVRLAAKTYDVDPDALRAAYDADDADAAAKRKIGKVQVLALGYGGGVGALAAFAESSGVDLAAAGLSAEDLVEAYRDAHPLVAGERTGSRVLITPTSDNDEIPAREPYYVAVRRGGLWRDLYNGLRGAFGDRRSGNTPWVVGPIAFGSHDPRRDVRDVVCYLPNGRPLRYRNVRFEDRPDKFSDEPGATRRTLVYDHAKGTRELYPGIVAENVTQATCRDLLAEALVRLEERGYRVVLHVHDEVVVEHPAHPDSGEAREALANVIQIVSEVPEWAPGFPIAAAGDVGRAWSK